MPRAKQYCCVESLFPFSRFDMDIIIHSQSFAHTHPHTSWKDMTKEQRVIYTNRGVCVRAL